MDKTILSTDQAKEIWQILVEECGANNDSETFEIATTIEGTTEYRFCGHLGFGGKIYFQDRITVSCYPEDETPERLLMINKANNRLLDLELQYIKADIDASKNKIVTCKQQIQNLKININSALDKLRSICTHTKFTEWTRHPNKAISDIQEISRCVYCDIYRVRPTPVKFKMHKRTYKSPCKTIKAKENNGNS